jgi:hypothetical protein
MCTTDLRWQSELLLGIAPKMVVGCDESAWHAAAPAAVALVLAIEVSAQYLKLYSLLLVLLISFLVLMCLRNK